MTALQRAKEDAEKAVKNAAKEAADEAAWTAKQVTQREIDKAITAPLKEKDAQVQQDIKSFFDETQAARAEVR